ncbi:VOC family protein [Kocuria atrinae]|uniref:VOC family protein n=1 Tax=Kocuria atrinae TaxID=592377 RepID=A0ABN2Y819_9MICC|nr:VOC family protein [Kocuria sp.]
MTSFVSSVAIDSHDPAALARFWCEVLDYRVDHVQDKFVSTLPSSGDGFRLDFIRVPEGKTVKNRLHLDLLPRDTDQQSEVARVEALGAYRVDVGQTSEDSWVVLADPEGNEFCILESHPAD